MLKKNKLKNNKIKNIKKIGELTRKRRIKNVCILSIFIMFGLSLRIYWIQFVMDSKLRELALQQQTLDRNINSKRGTIYDSTGKKILAVSSSVETVSVTPVNIKKEDKEKLAKAMSDIFCIDYETVLKKISKKTSIEIIVKQAEKTKTDKLRIWISENNISTGINIDEDTKRYYPYNNLASQIIGFCGNDNQGLEGIEKLYESELKRFKR